MKKLRTIIFLGVMLVMVYALSGCGKKTVNLNKYITITTEGYDSMGTAKYEFDREAFLKDYSGKLKVGSKKNKELRELGLFFGENVEELLLDYCVSQHLDKTSGLSNGDKITLEWNCEDAMAEQYFNVTLKHSDIKHKVSGLEKVDGFNPFDYVDISFSGIEPNGTITITPDYNQPEMQYIHFYAKDDHNLKNGDDAVVSASISGSVDNFVEKYGCIISETEKTYTVEGLEKYISDISDIPDDVYKKMDSHLQSILKADFDSWDGEELHNMQLLGNYLLKEKDGAYAFNNNYVYFVYKVTATNLEADGEFCYYWYGYYEDVKISAEGNCKIDLDECTVPSQGWFTDEKISLPEVQESHDYVYYGFYDLESLFESHVVDKIGAFEYISTVSE